MCRVPSEVCSQVHDSSTGLFDPSHDAPTLAVTLHPVLLETGEETCFG